MKAKARARSKPRISGVEKRDALRLMNAQQYVLAAQVRLQLGDWNVCLLPAPVTNENHAAETEIFANYRRADIQLSPHFWSMQPEEQRHWILHELAHVLLADYDNIFTKVIRKVPAKDGPRGFASWQYDVDDMLADKLARILAPLLPLPDLK